MRNLKNESSKINHLLMESENSIESEEELNYVLTNIRERYLFERRKIDIDDLINHRMYGNGKVIKNIDDKHVLIEFKNKTINVSKGSINSL